MYELFIGSLRTISDLLTAGVAVTAFSLLLYALSFNLRDRVARAFAFVMICVVFVYVGEALAGVADNDQQLSFWLRFQWFGIVFIPFSYFLLSDAILATTGKPSRGRRTRVLQLSLVLTLVFLVALPFSLLVGPLANNGVPVPHLERTWMTWLFTAFYIVLITLSLWNFWRAYKRTITNTGRRRMRYFLAGSLAPALGSFPYLLFGSGLAANFPLLFWFIIILSNLLVTVLLILMAYSVAFFGVSWPDRIIKRRLFKWLMRGPVTALTALALTTLISRAGKLLDVNVSTLNPVVMVFSIIVLEHLITLASPIWERLLFSRREGPDLELLQKFEERLLTQSDLQQYLETILAAACDRMQTRRGFIATISYGNVETLIMSREEENPANMDISPEILVEFENNINGNDILSWGEFWLVPLFDSEETEKELLGLLGIFKEVPQALDTEQKDALKLLSSKMEVALLDRRDQQKAFTSLVELAPEIEEIQRVRAAARYDGTKVLEPPESILTDKAFSQSVKDALTHYWGGPKLTQSPLMELNVVQQEMNQGNESRTNALRSVLRKGIDGIRPEGERKFTSEWILYNILELKFLEGRKVREVAMRLSVSEADLYRKQRIAIESVARAINMMESDSQTTIDTSLIE